MTEMRSDDMIWVYKCNSRRRYHGDWATFFLGPEPKQWGSTEWVRDYVQARRGDTVLAYQTDRNELVGIARVIALRPRRKFLDLILKPIRTLGVKVRPLKKRDPRVAAIPAFQPGPIRTLYEISGADARRLLRHAKASIQLESSRVDSAATSAKGAGFGTPEENRRVERAAVQHVRRQLRSEGWSVQDLSEAKNRGYDLLCRRGNSERHVEVKGARGDARRFIITAQEKRVWSTDKRFSLAAVTSALSVDPSVTYYNGPTSIRRFTFAPISFFVTPQA